MARAPCIVVLSLAACVSGCGRTQDAAGTTQPPASAAAFVDVTQPAGIEFRHINGMSGDYFFAEIMGPGVAVLDYDGDGDLDILALRGGALTRAPDDAQPGASCGARLYRNDLGGAGGGDGKIAFSDVTEGSGLCPNGYAMGLAVGDVDNDGCADVFVTHFAAVDQLFRNQCNGTFADAGERAGVGGDGRWGASASFFDYDRDGFLDLYVANYVDYALASNKACFNYTSARDYCSPTTYESVPGYLYHNRGDGTFEDVSMQSGIDALHGNALGVLAADFDGDGWQDIFVANDGNPNQLWINRRDGRFEDRAGIRGVAVNGAGAPEADMGIDLADVDGDGHDDLFVTHLTREGATLWSNLGEGLFEDRSAQARLTVATSPFTGFGTAFMDYDNDGWLDIVIANGAVHAIKALVMQADPHPLHQTKQLFRNGGDGSFVEQTQSAGAAFRVSEVGRGLAAGDLDNDGAMDFVVSNNNGPLRVYLNQVRNRGAWIGLRVLTRGRDAYGARVGLFRTNGPALWRRVYTDGSYLSARDPRVHIGLGDGGAPKALVVHWPDGRRERFPAPARNRYTTVVQGQGADG